jgi:creatinine amidohydrolase
MAAHTNPKVHMGTLTGGEGTELYKTNPIVLLPMGSHEDQGPHAPMGDYLLAEKIAELAALRATERGVRTVVAPVIPFGADDYFGPKAGGIMLSQGTMVSVLFDTFESLGRHGLNRVIVINGHGGNVSPIGQVARELYREGRQLVPSLYLWRIGYGLIPKIVGAEKAALVSGHGADPLSSIGMHLFPELMRPDMTPDAKPLKRDPVLDLPFFSLGSANFEGAEVGVPHEYDEVYSDGVGKGDPRLCSKETGAALTEQLTEICARFIKHYSEKVAA